MLFHFWSEMLFPKNIQPNPLLCTLNPPYPTPCPLPIHMCKKNKKFRLGFLTDYNLHCAYKINVSNVNVCAIRSI